MSKNLGNAGVVGETYTGSRSSLNYNNIVIAENERRAWGPERAES
jgi:hypothetical protein